MLRTTSGRLRTTCTLETMLDSDDTTASGGWTCDELTPDLCDDLTVEKGSVDIRGIAVHYWKYSQKHKQEDNTRLPIVMIHGGPGVPHNYMLPLKQQACRGRDLYFYDTAGCGKSALVDPDSFPEWLADLQYYAAEELPTLLEHWKLDSFHLVGDSTGGAFAMQYALDTSSAKIASIVLSSAFSDSVLVYDAQWDPVTGTLGRLPVFVRDRIWTMIDQEDYNSDEYGAIAMEMYQLFYIRTWPFPSCVMDSIMGTNPNIGLHIFGPARDFALKGGSMADFNITADLHNISVPVLLTEGDYDYDLVRPVVVDVLEQNIPNTERITLLTAGHVSMVDAPGDMNNAMADFFGRVESNTFVSNHSSAGWKSGFGIAVWLHAISIAVLFAIGVAIGRNWKSRQDYTHIS